MAESLVDYLKRREAEMSQEEMDRAIAIMRANGWSSDSLPPAWCWRIAFDQATNSTTTPEGR